MSRKSAPPPSPREPLAPGQMYVYGRQPKPVRNNSLKLAIDALQFYANERHWSTAPDGEIRALHDGGDIARDTLARIADPDDKKRTSAPTLWQRFRCFWGDHSLYKVDEENVSNRVKVSEWECRYCDSVWRQWQWKS